MSLNNFKIGTRLGTSFVLLTLILIGSISSAWYQLESVKSSMETALTASDRVAKSYQVDGYITKIYSDIYGMISATNDSVEVRYNSLKESRVNYRNTMDSLKLESFTDQDKAVVTGLSDAIKSCKDINLKIENLVLTGNSGEAFTLLDREGRPCKERAINIALTKLISYNNEEMHNALESASKTESTAMFILILSTLIAVAVSVVIAIIITKSITTPIKVMQGINSRLATGDFSENIPSSILNRQDEIGMLANSMQTVTENTRDIIRSVTENANNVASASTEISATTAQVSATSVEMSTQASTVASSAEQSTVSINQIAKSANGMSMSTSTVASAIEEMSASLNDVAMNGRKGKGISDQATAKTLKAMESIGKLNESTASIANIVDIISKIASQTNLLALNATIEAASAGEKGKGFAVVASEVKTLSKQTTQAVSDVKAKIESIKKDVLSTSEGMDSVSTSITELINISNSIMVAVEQQSVVIHEIAKSLASVDNETKMVASNVNESAIGLSHITHTITSVSVGTNETTKAINNVSIAVNDLAKMAESLRALVSKFRI